MSVRALNKLERCLAVLALLAVPHPLVAGQSAARWFWQEPQAKVLPTGDLQWAPPPFEFKAGASVRYIDFDAGNDSNDGRSQQAPWKHHPWDRKAAGTAKACKGTHTYVFKQGVVYRGELDANESGTAAAPIVLTRDPSWGTGPAVIGGLEVVTGWTKGADNPLIPEPEKVWHVDLDWAPRNVWMVGKDSTVWTTKGWVMGSPFPARVLAVDREHGSLTFPGQWGGEPAYKIIRGCQYYLEDKPQYLDSPGEFWFDKKGNGGRLYLRLPGDQDPNTAHVEVAKRIHFIESRGMSHVHIRGLTFRFAIETDAYARNVFYDVGESFGVFEPSGRWYQTLPAFRAALENYKPLAASVGSMAGQPPLRDAAAHDFQPSANSAARGQGAKVFVPWSLYETVAEWNFYPIPGDPTRILDEHWCMPPLLHRTGRLLRAPPETRGIKS